MGFHPYASQASPLVTSVAADPSTDDVEETFSALADAIENDENTVPYVIAAVKTYATMGGIMQVYEAAYGSYKETLVAS